MLSFPELQTHPSNQPQMDSGLMAESFLWLLDLMLQFQKAAQGGDIDCTKSFFLDIVHVDIAFGDWVLVGFFCYALILVDRATHYN
jgi:hypothetical protein